MEIISVDPRDQTWKIDDPRYRVYFYDADGGSDEYEISGADLADVMNWAEAQGHGRTYAVYACVPVNGLGLLRLHGEDPNERPRGNGGRL